MRRLRLALVLAIACLAQHSELTALAPITADCRDAIDEAESTASDLSASSFLLQQCSEAGDYSDDCSSEFSAVQLAHGDYEDAVSTVQAECDG